VRAAHNARVAAGKRSGKLDVAREQRAGNDRLPFDNRVVQERIEGCGWVAREAEGAEERRGPRMTPAYGLTICVTS
jgi:hypothetical protein